MNIIFQISGGIGKSILATAVCKAIKKKYPNDKLIVVSGYPDVFTNSKDVDMAFGFGQEGYFYTKYIENQDIKIMALEPYVVTEHVLQSEHLIETWCKLCDVPYNGEQPEVFINDRERSFFQEKYKSDKPILLMQTNGGAEQQQVKYSWARDIPRHVVQAVVDEFKNDFNIVHIKREDQYGFDGTFAVTDNYKGIAVLIEMSEKRLFMDSFAQHTAAALNKPSTVLWIANKPEVFGYELHNNIKANKATKKAQLKNSYIGKFNIAGDPAEFPYHNESEIFNIDEIIKSLK
jgi:ADP-heptose:LPS heptosyltransferase